MKRTPQTFTRNVRCFGTPASLQQTNLFNYHKAHGGKMVDFGGWHMPVQYNDLSIAQSTVHTRTDASIFDVSHMGQLRFWGDDREKFLQGLICGSVKALKQDQTRYSLFMNDQGGVIDDTVVTRRKDHMFVVINAGRLDVDIPYLQGQIANSGMNVEMEIIKDHDLLAFQGPKAVTLLQKHTDYDLSKLGFFYVANMDIDGIPCQVSRSGYTGEDGFEISIPTANIEHMCDLLLSHDESKLAGLGARDALRLEAGLCLYGHELDETTSPVEADLMWTVGKRKLKGGFPGFDVVKRQLMEGVTRQRIGLVGEKAPFRDGAEVYNEEGRKVGVVVSGSFSPCLKKPIGMAYIEPSSCQPGLVLNALVRKKKIPVTVTKFPFVQKGYFKTQSN